MTYRKKLIEVALPLGAINKACVREKSIRHGHPSTLHLWWARRPLAAARSVIFSQMVDDPSTYVDVLREDPKLRRKAESALKAKMKTWQKAHDSAERAKGTDLSVRESAPTLDETLADRERQRLFRIIEELVLWENTTNEQVLEKARKEIWQSWRRACADNVDHPQAKELFNRQVLPAFHDPFAGGGTLPLEAQRLGLESYASDLNPVAVLINKAMIEIPPRFVGKPPVNPDWQSKRDDEKAMTQWECAQGLAEDVRYYGQWMRDKAEKQIGHLYPKIEITDEMVKERPDLKPYGGRELTVIAWLWVRTVKSPNPAFADVKVPLASTFMLSTKAGKEAYVEPIIEDGNYRFIVKSGKPKNLSATKSGTSAGKRAAFICLMSGTPITYKHIRGQGKDGNMDRRLMAIIAKGNRGQVYLSPSHQEDDTAVFVKPEWKPELLLPENKRDFKSPNYGINTFGDLFTNRQLIALQTFSDLVSEVQTKVISDAKATGMTDDDTRIDDGGKGATAYAEVVAVYLGLGVGRSANYWSSFTTWAGNFIVQTFGRQAIPMVWDYAEGNPFSNSTGNWSGALNWIEKVMVYALPASLKGIATQDDAQTQVISQNKVVSTDPPYYDNIGYAELSDFFYVWLRRSLKTVFPELFATLAVPKSEELIAAPHRQGGKEQAEAFFLEGMTHAMSRLAEQAHPAIPITIFYAFKQSETKTGEGVSRTGWETFLSAVIRAGFVITGTWPMRTERDQGLKTGKNVLASSIILVCRPRDVVAPSCSRREFANVLKSDLPIAILQLQHSNVAPVDIAQAAIGPGMAVYTRFEKVIDAEGKPLSVHDALSLINQILDETLVEQENDFDSDSRWALTWFRQQGFDQGEYGIAEQLSLSKNTSVEGLITAGILESGSGKVRLLKPQELPEDWDPNTDDRLTQWEAVHHLIRVMNSGGESAAAELVTKLGSKAETARELCYRLYNICEQNKWATEGLAYNTLVQSWPEILRLSKEQESLVATPEQASLLNEES